jgi:adenine-specific DNA-methyltransferase
MSKSAQKKHKNGQYFTKDLGLKQKVSEYILNNPSVILEPSIGRGDLVSHILENKNIIFDMYELDTTIELLPEINHENVKYGDFINQSISKLYTTIIGNPPYIRTKTGNLYIDFTRKCFNLLEQNGELIFIVPSDFLKLTSSVTLLNTMMTEGTFTHIYHPHNENLFENASIDVIVFRYCKNASLDKRVLYNDNLMYITNSNGLITFSEASVDLNTEGHVLLQDYFDIYVGIVNGKEEVYKNEALGNISVLNGKNKINKYIFVESFPTDNPAVNTHLLEHKPELISRKIKSFSEANWFEWGAPRNINTIRTQMGKECIYIYNLTRNTEVAFLGNVQYFGGSLLILIPKKTCNLQSVVGYLNSTQFKHNFTFSERFKIGHRQLCNSHIPAEFL